MNHKLIATTLCMVLALTGCSSTKSADYTSYQAVSNAVQVDDSNIAIAINTKHKVPFRGDYEAGNNVGSSHILYQGGAGVGGLFAQVLTHAAINGSQKDKMLSNKQKEANKVLAPLHPVLDSYSMGELTAELDHFNFVSTEDAGEAQRYVLNSSPTFYLSQDGKQLTLKHIVSVVDAKTESTVYQNLVEVLAPAIVTDEPMKILKANNGEVLQEMASELYHYSLVMILADVSGRYTRDNSKQKSFKLVKNGKTRYERGVLLDHSTDRKVIRNLRGWLIAFADS